MIVGTPAKDEKLLLAKYLDKRIQLQNNVSEMFNDTYTVTSILHFSEKQVFLQKLFYKCTLLEQCSKQTNFSLQDTFFIFSD